MLRSIWSSLLGLFDALGQGWIDSGSDADLGHEMDPDG